MVMKGERVELECEVSEEGANVKWFVAPFVFLIPSWTVSAFLHERQRTDATLINMLPSLSDTVFLAKKCDKNQMERLQI